MKIKHVSVILLTAIIGLTFSCKKNEENVEISEPQYQVGQIIDQDTLPCGSVKGTLKSGRTYYLNCDVTVNKGDTLVIQNDVKLIAISSAQILVKGSLISLGSEDHPNWLTIPEGQKSTPNVVIDPASDPAFTGKWGGIQCDTSCKLLVLKWTHVEYTGAVVGANPIFGQTQGVASASIFFQNANGVFIMEDSWIYGTTDDGLRINGGKISIMRNTFEKCSYSGGDVINLKNGTVGDAAYNLCIGSATNMFKVSNAGGSVTQCNINVYNNTMVNGGYRQIQSGRGGSINFEKGAKGKIYNNLMVNCKYSFRVVGGSSIADTVNMKYGNTFHYGDSASVVNQFYPVGYITQPKATDLPVPSTFLPSPYNLGDAYTPTINIVGTNNPLFVGFTLPMTAAKLSSVNFVGNANFRLQSASPAIGKGYTNFSPMNTVYEITDANLAANINEPGADIGAYQSNGTGNKH